MRRSKMGEAYCHTANELRSQVEMGDVGWEVYATNLSDPEEGFGATAEILENVTGNLVCHVEAPDMNGVRAILTEVDIEVQ